MEKILITGANGFLGQHLCVYLSQLGYQVVATGRGESRLPIAQISYESADLTNQQEVKRLLMKHEPATIVHTAAMSKPDECDQSREACIEANIEATRHLLSGNAFFVYTSTDFIFGEDGPHSEDAQAYPLNFYGETKLKAEELVKQLATHFAIVRPVFIYGKVWPGLRPSFLQWVKNNLQQHKSIKVVSDQLRTPTYVGDICAGIHTIVRQKATGTFHLAGRDVVSPYEMALTTAQVLGLDSSLVEKVTSETFPEPVKRAKRSGLRIDKAVNELNYDPVTFAEGVRLTFSED